MSESNLLDQARSVCLCDVGLPNYLAATAVADDGSEHLLLALHDGINDHQVVYDHHCRNVAHEQPGRLPGGWRERVWGELARCGRPTASGQPCRRMVSTPGESCTQHRGLTDAPSGPPRRRYPRAVCTYCDQEVAVAPKRGTFTPHGIYQENLWGAGWEQCPMSGRPVNREAGQP